MPDFLVATPLKHSVVTKSYKFGDGISIEKLSPILLVRGAADGSTPLQIADGYHRVCASYVTDENTDIPCRLVSWQ